MSGLKLILHLQSIDGAVLAVRAAKTLIKSEEAGEQGNNATPLIGCSFGDGSSYSALRRAPGAVTITVYEHPRSGLDEPDDQC